MSWKTVLIVLVLVAGGAAVAVLSSMLHERRYSHYYDWVSRWVSPISMRLYSPSQVPTAIPFSDDFTEGELRAGWLQRRTEWLDWKVRDSALMGTTNRISVWVGNRQGPLFYRYVRGDVAVEASVQTRKASDPDHYPDRNWQFGGLIFRDPRGDAWFGRENYVFNVVGHRGQRLEIETKSTLDSVSRVVSAPWPTGDADLKIVRRGPVFELFARATGDQPWQLINRVQRPDLPEVLQVGIIVYSGDDGDGIYDLQARIDRFSLSPVNAKTVSR